MPDRVDGDLDAGNVATVAHDRAVDLEPLADIVLEFRKGQPRLGDGDRRPDVDALGDFAREGLADLVAERIDRDDAAGFRPLREGADLDHRMGVGEVGALDRVERTRGDGQGAIEGVGTAMGADGVAIGSGIDGGDDRPASLGRFGPPIDLEA